MNDYWKTEEGQTNSGIIADQRVKINETLYSEAMEKVRLNPNSILEIAKEYNTKLEAAYDEIFQNNV